MNLTKDREQGLIKEFADKIKLSEKHVIPEETYWVKRDDVVEKIDSLIDNYDFSTPLELQDYLTDIWERFEDNEMKELASVCSVAAFKNRKRREEQRVSTFVYEF